jgi:septal ring factor EnvC (AmiA/AmiB activator)
MKTLRKIWDWVKAHWKWVVAGLAVLGALILGTLVARRSGDPAPLPEKTQKRKEKVAFLQGEINQLEGQKDVIQGQEEDAASDIKKADDQVAKIDGQIAEVREEVSTLSAEEKLKRFKNLGY